MMPFLFAFFLASFYSSLAGATEPTLCGIALRADPVLSKIEGPYADRPELQDLLTFRTEKLPKLIILSGSTAAGKSHILKTLVAKMASLNMPYVMFTPSRIDSNVEDIQHILNARKQPVFGATSLFDADFIAKTLKALPLNALLAFDFDSVDLGASNNMGEISPDNLNFDLLHAVLEFSWIATRPSRSFAVFTMNSSVLLALATRPEGRAIIDRVKVIDLDSSHELRE